MDLIDIFTMRILFWISELKHRLKLRLRLSGDICIRNNSSMYKTHYLKNIIRIKATSFIGY